MPCQGNVRVVAQRTAAAGLAADADAWVTFSSPLGANNLAAPAATYTNCTIAFGKDRWPTSASMLEDWGLVCSTMVHELGHLLGHQHDTAPGSVMAPVFTDRAALLSVCRAAPPGHTASRSRSAR